MNEHLTIRGIKSRGLIPVLAAVLLGALLLLRAAAGSPAPRLQPDLARLAAQHPDAVVRVIVQKTAADPSVEALAASLGQITRELPIINSLVVELPARSLPTLASAEGVRWLSLDAAVKPSEGQVVSTAWATMLGSAVVSNWTTAGAAADSMFGPNGAFAYGTDNKKVSFTGFNVEDTPGNAIARVEALFYEYVPTPIGHDLKLHLYLNGSKIKDFTVPSELLNLRVGAANPGAVAFDITSARAWKWADFDNSLELGMDLGPFDDKDFIYLDAIGVRVTSNPGADSTINGGPTSLPKAAVDATKLINAYNQTVRAPAVWNEAPNYWQGQGVTVAVIDSGITKHYDVGSRLIGRVNFNDSYHDSLDRYGHGTFVASVIAGDGKKSGGQFIGTAPKTNLVNVRISDDQGMATESDVIQAMQWVLNNKTRYNIRVVNLSLNSSQAQSYHTSPMDAACEILWFNGVVVVVSAGNNGSANLLPPANDPFVITVGATDDRGTMGLDDDFIAPFSAYGLIENGLTKPDLVAPGTNIVAYVPENDKINMGRSHPNNRVSKDYFRASGTSFAAPIVSGAVAMLLQSNPGLNPDQVKYRLKKTANRSWIGYDAAKAGAGYLDIYAAVKGTTIEMLNTGIPVSALLTTGENGVLSASVNWSSVNWSSVNWSSVNWSSVNWSSVNWSSDYWEP